MIKIVFFLFSIFTVHFLFAQQESPSDIIVKNSGEQIRVKITEVSENEVKFNYPGETAVYSLKKEGLQKIIFSSGRTEMISSAPSGSVTSAPAPTTAPDKPAESRNKIAILPFSYIIDKVSAGDEMGYTVQQEAFSFMSRHVGEKQLQDPKTTNALLIKNGVNSSNIRSFTTEELCKTLQVEYLISGRITQDRTGTTSSQNSNTTYKNNSGTSNKYGTYSSAGSTSTYQSNTQNFKTGMTLEVMNDKGESLFSNSHNSFWSTTDAYKITLQYLLKRTPLYVK